MSDWATLQNQIAILLAAGVFATVIIESILSAKWSPSYFRKGIPIFTRRFLANPSSNEPPPAYELEDRFHSKIASSIVFKKIGATEYAFRYKLFEPGFRVRYGPTIMRGLIQWDFDKQQVIVRGHMYWTTFLSCILIVVMSIGPGLPIILIPLVLLSLFYVIEAWRFSDIGKFAAKCW